MSVNIAPRQDNFLTLQVMQYARLSVHPPSLRVAQTCRTLWTSSCLLGRDYYEVMGLSRTCSQKEIRDKYVELCKLHHPDIAKDEKQADEKKRKFQEINEAYTQLMKVHTSGGGRSQQQQQSKPESKRREYEYRYRPPPQDTDTGGWTFSWLALNS